MSFPESAPPADPVPPKPDQTPVVVKKYANRRLYNTESSSYITLDNLATMIRQSRISWSMTPRPARTSPVAC